MEKDHSEALAAKEEELTARINTAVVGFQLCSCATHLFIYL